jgi:nucleoside-diphosphate-sugar epimerase
MPSLLFIGGTGLISAECAALAAARGFEVFALTRGRRQLPQGVRGIVAEASDPASVRNAIAGRTFDVVADFIAYKPEDVARNVEIFGARCGQFVHISTCAAYLKPPPHWRVTEETPLGNPFWGYAQLKIAAERVAMEAHAQGKFPVTIVRPSHTYGDSRIPAPFHNSAHSWTHATRLLEGRPIIVHGDGTTLWQVTHAADFAKGFVGLLGNPKTIGKAFHITSDEVLTWNQIVETTAEALGVKANLVHIPTDFIEKRDPAKAGGLRGDKMYSAIFDNTKIKTFVPGFEADIPFAQGVRRTIAWFRADPKRQTLDATFDALADRIIAAHIRNDSE